MDQRERMNDSVGALQAALDGHQSDLWTAMPGIIVSFNADEQTAVVQPAIKGVGIAKDGSNTSLTLPVISDVPVQFPSGGKVTMTFPVAKDDECLLVFGARSIDAWWQSGGVQSQVEGRMHHLADAIAFVGLRSKPKVPSDISTTAMQIRSLDASTVIELDPDAQTITLTAPGGITINGNVTLNGSMTATDDVTAGSISLENHTHGGVQTGSGETGAPEV